MEVREISIDKKYNCEDMLGKFLDESHADILIENEAVNVYGPKGVGQTENDESNLICGLRPGVFSQEEIAEAYDKTVRGVKTVLTRRCLACADYTPKASNE